jgi:hypothetical protein
LSIHPPALPSEIRTWSPRAGFDPQFDDRVFFPDILSERLETSSSGGSHARFRVEHRTEAVFSVYGRTFVAEEPVRVRILFDAENRIWMSDHPQERMMMAANARVSRGRVLVGGLGLGIFPQFAQLGRWGRATQFTIVERSSEVIALTKPSLDRGLAVPFDIVQDDVEHYLRANSSRFDTVFLDTWDSLEPKRLPSINGLRELALDCLEDGGQVLAWGYRWMIEMFASAFAGYAGLDELDRRGLREQFSRLPDAATGDAALADLFEDVLVDEHFTSTRGRPDRARAREYGTLLATATGPLLD